ncbi:MAG: hypothetical protein KGJ68_04805 [Gammaproteobacteria bacterium]|nr:hypothetical protein [Gammaproteobacteria bacterium]
MKADLHGAHLRTLEAVFRHPPAHNLEWMDAISLIERIGAVRERGGNSFSLEVGGERLLMHKPHTKELSSTNVADLRNFLQRAGWSPQGQSPVAAERQPAAPVLVVAMQHHGASIYQVSGDAPKREIRPYDPHHFLHHLTHKEQSREAGQRAPEEPAFYESVAAALATGGAIVVVGHGTGKSNAAQHLTEFLRTHHPETHQRIVRELEADLSAITPAQLLALVEQGVS